jgi:hypothetical protein
MTTAVDVPAVDVPDNDDYAALPMGARAMLEDMEQMRMGNIVAAWRNGDIGSREASTLTMRRVGQKLGIAAKVAVPTSFGDDKANFKKATFMEGGWEKRGSGSSLKRTIEIYSFGIKVVLRELKLRKVEDKIEKSVARKIIASDLREVGASSHTLHLSNSTTSMHCFHDSLGVSSRHGDAVAAHLNICTQKKKYLTRLILS